MSCSPQLCFRVPELIYHALYEIMRNRKLRSHHEAARIILLEALAADPFAADVRERLEFIPDLLERLDDIEAQLKTISGLVVGVPELRSDFQKLRNDFDRVTEG